MRQAQEVELGKTYYEAGNFKQAFHVLLPLAAAGNAKAQYAVGYMYYYGYGVTEDNESGLFWMNKSAEQGYIPAKKALEMIHQHNDISAKSNELKRQEIPEDVDVRTRREDAVLQTLPRSKKIETRIEIPQSKRIETRIEVPPKKLIGCKKVIESRVENPVKKPIRADGYALQLFGSYSLESAKQMQRELGVQQSAVIWHAENNHKDWYVLMYGHYATVADARLAKNAMPKKLRDMGPWVRGLEGLG